MNLDSLKRDIRTTEFWFTVATVVATWLATLVTDLSPRYAVIATVAATAFYSLAQGIQKNSTDLNHGASTTEFWVGLVNTAIVVFASVQGSIPDRYAALGTVLNLIAYTLSRGIAKPDPQKLELLRPSNGVLDKVDASLDGDNGNVNGEPPAGKK